MEQWKEEHEAKLEEMKKKVRSEVDARMKLEEEHKLLQRQLQEKLGSGSGLSSSK